MHIDELALMPNNALFVKGFPLDNPPSWDEYLTFDPYRTGHKRNILFEQISFNEFKSMLSH